MLFDVRADALHQHVLLSSGADGPLGDLLPDQMDDGLGSGIGRGVAVRLGEALLDDVVERAELLGNGLAGNARMEAGRQQCIGARARPLEPGDGDAAGIRQGVEHEALVVHDLAVVDDDVAGLCMADLVADDVRAVAGNHEVELDAVLVLVHRADAAVPVIEADEPGLLLKGRGFLLVDVDGDGHGDTPF